MGAAAFCFQSAHEVDLDESFKQLLTVADLY